MKKLEIKPITIITGDPLTGKTVYLEKNSDYTWGVEIPLKLNTFLDYNDKSKQIQFCEWLKKYFHLELIYEDVDKANRITFKAFKSYTKTIPYSGDFYSLGRTYSYLLNLLYNIFSIITTYPLSYEDTRITFGICNIEGYVCDRVLIKVLAGLIKITKDYRVNLIIETNSDIPADILSTLIYINAVHYKDIIIYVFNYIEDPANWDCNIKEILYDEEGEPSDYYSSNYYIMEQEKFLEEIFKETI